MVDGELKSKPAIDSKGGGISVDRDSEEGSGVVTSLAEHESSEDSRMRFEDDSDESEREDDDGDGESCSDDTEIFEVAGVIARYATLVSFGTRLGSGAIFLREDDFAFGDGSSSALRRGVATRVAGVDVGFRDSKTRFRDGGAETVGRGGTRKRREAVVGRMNAARGAASGFVVMNIVAAERSGLGCGGDVLFAFARF